MNGFYNMFLCLFLLGAVGGAVNELHVFGMNVPTQTMRIDDAVVSDFQSGAESQTTSDFSVWEVVSSFMRVVGSGVTALFLVGLTVCDLWTMAGGDAAIGLVLGGLVQAPVTFVTLFGLYELWTGRSVT